MDWVSILLGGGCAPNFVRRFFVDLRLIAGLMCMWLVVVMLILTEIGIFSNPNFVAFGPRSTLTFMHVSIDTSYKYSMLVLMIVLHTLISDFIADSLSPHMINTLQDMRTRFIPHRPVVYYIITSIWAVYCAVSQLFMIFLALGQLDLLLVRLASDIAANALTTTLYLENKQYDPQRYERYQHRPPAANNNNNDDEPPPAAQPQATATATAAPEPQPPNRQQQQEDEDDEEDDDEVVFESRRPPLWGAVGDGLRLMRSGGDTPLLKLEKEALMPPPSAPAET